MVEQPDEFEHKLTATFRAEALDHLLRLESRFLSLEQSGQAAGVDLARRMLSELHTLKGAARAAGRSALAELCHAFETVVSSSGFAASNFAGKQFDALHEALKVARKLVESKDGRTLNQARASTGRLDALAQELAGGVAAPPLATPLIPDPEPAAAPHWSEAHSAIRVPTRHLDLIRQHAEEMLLVELDLQHAAQQLEAPQQAEANAAQLLQHCRRAARELERLRHRFNQLRNGLLESALETSMEPLSTVLEQMPGLVRGMARAAGKQVTLEMSGAEACVDRRILEPLRDILIQLLTNAVDHGIEAAPLRHARGKPESGKLSISVATRGADEVEVTLADDGGGIDLKAVALAATASQHLTAEEIAGMNEAQLTRLVFRPGLSTAATVTPSSGRGVGLALVADKLASVGGAAEVQSRPGAGCRFRLSLPVRMTRMLGLALRVRGARFVLPLPPLRAVLSLNAEQLHMVKNLGSLRWEDAMLPAISVARALGLEDEPQAKDKHEQGQGQEHDRKAVIARGANGPFALLVDEILEEQEVLPKPLGRQLRRVRYLSGATQLADGALVPILALDQLARFHHSARAPLPAATRAAPAPARLLVAEDSPTTRVLLRHILESAGYAVETAVDGLDAWARLRGAHFDALVSDVSMPGLDGFALCERVRADSELKRLPVVLVTSLQSAREKERGLHAGAHAYLSKGAFDQDALLSTLRRLIGTETA